ncbi:hypothetical protein Csa_022372 [Cucumis sativus]|nr:hypothetical protein Csa_022372 [Cucumis sativus]
MEGCFKTLPTSMPMLLSIKRLQPMISVWTNGRDGQGLGGAGNMAMKELSGVHQMLPPLFQTDHEQTRLLPPPWMRFYNISFPETARLMGFAIAFGTNIQRS